MLVQDSYNNICHTTYSVQAVNIPGGQNGIMAPRVFASFLLLLWPNPLPLASEEDADDVSAVQYFSDNMTPECRLI